MVEKYKQGCENDSLVFFFLGKPLLQKSMEVCRKSVYKLLKRFSNSGEFTICVLCDIVIDTMEVLTRWGFCMMPEK